MVAPTEVADADAHAELVILDLRDHLDRTAKTEPMAQLAEMATMALITLEEITVAKMKVAKNVVRLPLAHPEILDPREHPAQPDPLEKMPRVVELVLLALLVLLDQQEHLVDPDQRDLPALPDM